jgi:N-hydroxyarylamine O-acetyltransferase
MNLRQVEQYLARIHWRGPVQITPETLRGLHLAHLRSVPFENLSIHLGESIRLDIDSLFDKIVARRQGGFCYEANGLFCALLNQLGFSASMLSAQVARSDGGYSPPYDHMVLLVQLANPWLVDVGFGDSFRLPLKLHEPGVQPESGRSYLLEPHGHGYLLKQNILDRGWEAQFKFALEPHPLRDFEDMCQFHQTSPTSHFRKSKLATLATEDGRITLSGMKLIRSGLDGSRSEVLLSNEHDYSAALAREFDIDLARR